MRKNEKSEEKLNKRLLLHKNFLMEELRKEWSEIEHAAKSHKFRKNMQEKQKRAADIILGLLILGGIVTVAAVAPNVFSAYGHTTRRRAFLNKEEFFNVKKYLKRHKLVRLNIEGKSGYEIAITEKGTKRILNYAFNKLKIKRQIKWDGYWRIVIFDIPRKENWARNSFREKLKELGFYKLQNSVFIFPYPCDKELGHLISIFNIAPYVHVIRANGISIEKALRNYFKLEKFA